MEARAPLAWMIGIASIQGFALYGLYRSIEIDVRLFRNIAKLVHRSINIRLFLIHFLV